MVALTTAMVGFATRNLAVGFGAGIVLLQVSRLTRHVRTPHSRALS